ncbi:DUF4870 domain-containing protein [Paenibacillus sp. JX-17]|uniref:DUF4870 domain-containing protein n=1 Tax=Paenibacillus lacisoli TaxID=3064525 RepID=A0ABT9CH40_9BACL|nr:DUF4870 domain-containing protein [Paenibacillus sp. JX-17]MDO7906913.1 DUF4870 domain-containing protein [Paenibacillus sp. JX-17]
MRQILASLCYFSIFFAPFLFPIIVWIAARDAYVSSHAKKSLFSHFIGFAAVLVFIARFFLILFNAGTPGSFWTTFWVCGVVYAASFVYNVVLGFKVLRDYA